MKATPIMCHPAWFPIALAILGFSSVATARQEFPTPYDSQDPGEGLTPAREALDGMRLPEGFQASLFASEPDVRQPIALATDPRGRLWVAENYTYAEAERNFDTELRDRVVILEDSNHDGQFDTRTIFWDEGVRLTSVEVGFGGVWVLCAPYLLFIPDRDGDDQPDGPPVVMLDGWEADSIRHNLVNGLRWGPDGWLYGRHGIQATSRVGRPGTPDDDRAKLNCGVWRFHPTRHEFEVVYRGTTNPWGMDWDEHGQLFMINTVIPHLWHIVPGGFSERMYGEHFHPHLYALLGQTADHVHWDTRETWDFIREGVSATTDQAGGGHAHAGLLIYQGTNWPEEYRGDVFALNFHGRRINRDRLRRVGATYSASHLPDPIAWDDSWFRGIDLISGPDGGVFVADWSDTGECHENDGVHRSSGRIYKITHGKTTPPEHLNLSTLGDRSLVDLFRNPDVWSFRQARRILQERAASDPDRADAREALLTLLAEAKGNVPLQLRALWGLFGIGEADEPWLISLLDDPSEHLRTWAILLLVDDGAPSEPVMTAFAQLADREQSGLVLTFLASALQKIPTEQRWSIAEAIASKAEFVDDPALPLMLWYGIEPAVLDAPDRAAELAASGPIGPLSRFIARRLTAASSGHPDRVSPLVNRLSRVDDPRTRSAMLAGMADAVRGLRNADPPPGWHEAVEALDQLDDQSIRPLVRELSVVYGGGRALEELREIASDQEAELLSRRDAIGVLVRGQADGLLELLGSLLSDRDLGADAVRGLATVDDPESTALILQRLSRMPIDARQAAVTALASRAGSASALLDAVEAEQVARSEVSAFVVRQLRTLGDEGLSSRVASLWPEYRPITETSSARIEGARRLLTPDRLSAADPSQGRLLFSKTCAQCHVLFGDGGAVGPELTGAQRADLGYLLENLIDPNATLDDDYRMTVFALADGRIINGLIAEQTDRTVTIQTPTERIIVPRDEIEEERRSELSLMPEGLLDPLDDQGMADLIRYLQSPTQVPLPTGSATELP